MLQILANTIIAASMIVLVGIGFGLIYRTARFFHFAHAATFTVAAYAALGLTHAGLRPTWLAIAMGIACAAAVGGSMELLVFRPLRRRGAGGLVLLLASLGLYLVLESMVALLFGSEVQLLRDPSTVHVFQIGQVRVTNVQVWIFLLALLALASIALFLRFTALGKAVRALAADPVLARTVGIPVDRTILIVFAAGSAFAGLAGVLLAMDVHLRPTMGIRPLFLAVIAVIVGGPNRIGGLAVGALLLAAAQNAGAMYLGNQWQDTIAFIVLVLALLIWRDRSLGSPRKQA